MKVEKLKKVQIIGLIVLVISLLFNVITGVQQHEYKKRVGTESYNNIESIKTRNENNLEILKAAKDSKVIYNNDLLKLYKSYSNISDSFMNLWNEYSFYEEIKYGIFAKKKIENENPILSDISGKIEDYLCSVLDKEMQNKEYKLELSGTVLDNFNNMYTLATELDTYYKNFYASKLDNATDDKKKDKIINNYYWIDILKGLDEINKRYADVEMLV